jgi:cytochrome P450
MSQATVEDLRPLAIELLGSPAPPQDPYPLYHRLRSAAPRHHDPELGMWFLSTYADCAQALRDPRLGRAPQEVESRLNGGGTRRPRQARPSMLFLNPPEHTRQRKLVNRGFTPRRVEALRPHIEQLTDECLDRIAQAGEADIMDLLAFPLPVAVIGELVGVPRSEQAQFREVAPQLTAGLDPIQSDESIERVEQAREFFRAYFLDLAAQRRAEPRDDLMSVLVQAEESGDILDEDEIMSVVILLFAAGFETTTNLIGSGLLVLLHAPDQLARLRADRSLLPTAVEEMLRFDSPVQVNGRYALEDTHIGDQPIPAGTSVVTFLGAGNRDPDQFPDPDRFDVGRDDGAPLSFGGGIHYCLGAALARLEAQVVFDRLLDRFAGLELLEEPTFRPSVTLRGVEELRVRCTPA